MTYLCLMHICFPSYVYNAMVSCFFISCQSHLKYQVGGCFCLENVVCFTITKVRKFSSWGIEVKVCGYLAHVLCMPDLCLNILLCAKDQLCIKLFFALPTFHIIYCKSLYKSLCVFESTYSKV